MDGPTPVPALSQLKILKTVVLSVAVLVVDRLGGLEVTAEVLLHDEAMLEHVTVLMGTRMIGLMDLYVAPRTDQRLTTAKWARFDLATV